LKINAGGSLRLLSAAGTPAMVRFVTGTNILNIGAIHATDNLTFWGDTANSADLVFGYAANALITQRFNQIYNYVYSKFNVNQVNPTGSSYFTAYNGIIDLTASQYILLDAPYVRGTNTTDIGHPSTSSYRFRNLYLTGNIGGVSARIQTLYCSAVDIAGGITMTGALTGATGLTTSGIVRGGYLEVYVSSGVYARLTQTFANSGVPPGLFDGGYLTVNVNGTTRYIKLYSA